MAGRVTQEIAEGLSTATSRARVTQEEAEALTTATSRARVSQEEAEALATALSRALASQIVVEVLVVNLEEPMLPVFPTHTMLPGLGFNVKWSPNFYNMPTATTVTGADIDLALADTPLHDFELVYEFLRDNPFQNKASLEFKTMMGFFLRIGGTSGRFLFQNDDDFSVQQQFVATTDGVLNMWPLKRTFGVGDNSGTEEVGYVDLTSPFAVYFDGVLQDADSYSVIQSTPCDQQLKINATPGAGKRVTVDMSYFYYCKFPDNTYTFEKFLYRTWQLQSIKLHSCRADA